MDTKLTETILKHFNQVWPDGMHEALTINHYVGCYSEMPNYPPGRTLK